MSKKFKYIGAHNGIAIENAFTLVNSEIKIPKHEIKISEIDSEISKLKKAISKTESQLEEICEIASSKLSAAKAEIFYGHIAIATDSSFEDDVTNLIKNKKINVSQAVDQVSKTMQDMMLSLDDEYMKERALDIKDVYTRLQKNLLGIDLCDLSTIKKPTILIASDLTPSESVNIDPKYIKGIINEVGAMTSHVVIIAKSLDIPTVVGFKDATKIIKNNDSLIMNGTTGEVILNPNNDELSKAKEDYKNLLERKKFLQTVKDKPTVTKDGHQVHIEANIGSFKDWETALNSGAEGCGLFRTEFLYMENDNWPTEDEQFEIYKKIAALDKNKMIVVRTLDIGGDKDLKYHKFKKEMNPFLGLRAIRFCLEHKDIFKTQLRALLRASHYGNIYIMLPMVATVNEFISSKKILEECKIELIKKNIPFNKDIKLGTMVEIPSVAIMAKQFMRHVDFFSVGTNDLIQYSMATDRMEPSVSYLYQPLNPAIIKLIKSTIDASHNANKWTGVCGSMAGMQEAIPILIGLGLDYFSMSASSILESRYLIRRLNYSNCKILAKKVLNMDSQEEVQNEVSKFFQNLPK